MSWRHPTAQDFDHAHDSRKNWSEDQFPARLDVDIPTSVDIAVLVRDPNVKLSEAAALIEQYARTVASGAAVDATHEAGKRVEAILASVKR